MMEQKYTMFLCLASIKKTLLTYYCESQAFGLNYPGKVFGKGPVLKHSRSEREVMLFKVLMGS